MVPALSTSPGSVPHPPCTSSVLLLSPGGHRVLGQRTLSHPPSVPWVTTSSHAAGEPRTRGGGVCDNICSIIHRTSFFLPSFRVTSGLGKRGLQYPLCSKLFSLQQNSDPNTVSCRRSRRSRKDDLC